jgi:hypothetical protein
MPHLESRRFYHQKTEKKKGIEELGKTLLSLETIPRLTDVELGNGL